MAFSKVRVELSTVCIFTPRLPLNVTVFPTHYQRFFNGLEINLTTITIYMKLMKFAHIVVAEYLVFDRYSEEIRPFGSIH